MEHIGFIGLGNMGFHMAARLLKAGHPLTVYDANSAIAQRITSLGASWAASAQEVASAAEVVILSLPTPKVVEEVLTGESGVNKGSAVKIVVDTSTTGPETTIRMAALLDESNIDLIDAPVSGGVTGAEDGSLAIMASGKLKSYETISPLLQNLGSKLFYLGEKAGQGQVMKIINNTLCATATLSAFEGLVLGSKAGLDSKTMLDVINTSSGRSFATEVKIPQCVLDREFPLRFTTDLLHKDVKLCLDESARLGVPMWINDATRQMLLFGISQGDGPIDYGNLIKHYEAWAGAQFGNNHPTTEMEKS